MAGKVSESKNVFVNSMSKIENVKKARGVEFNEMVKNDTYKNVHTGQLTYFYTNLQKFKSQTGVIDFDDMLLKALYPTVEFQPYKLVLVDEVQDLSKLEWQVISKIAQKTEELFLVGDDDQAIFGWKGSDVSIFQKWPCKKENVVRLETSYRLPGKIYDFALSIRDDIKYRLGNEFTCQKRINPDQKDEGQISYINGLDEIEDLKTEKVNGKQIKYRKFNVPSFLSFGISHKKKSMKLK